jgi:TonB family protein
MQKFLLFFITLLLSTLSFAQKDKADTAYYNSRGDKCAKEGSEYYMVIQKLGKRIYRVGKITTSTNILERTGLFSDIDPMTREGLSTTYFSNGKKSSEGNFVKDKQDGIWTIWDEGSTDSLVINCFNDGTYKNVYVPVSHDHNNKMDVSYKLEHMPEYPGGIDSLMTYVGRNVKYPQVEKEAGISGTCYVTFVVDKDGSVTDVKILRGVKGGPGCDEEALRVVKSMPAWIPGEQNGKLVRVQFNLPIKFRLH